MMEHTTENAVKVQTLIEEALSKLGKTAGDVAAALTQLGIKGKRSCAGECVLHVYLCVNLPEFGAQYEMEVAKPAVTVMYRYEAGSREVWAQVRLPEHLTEFIWSFDEGMYPDLDLEPDEIKVKYEQQLGDYMKVEVYQGGRQVGKWVNDDIYSLMADGLVHDVRSARCVPEEVEKLKESVVTYCREMGMVR